MIRTWEGDRSLCGPRRARGRGDSSHAAGLSAAAMRATRSLQCRAALGRRSYMAAHQGMPAIGLYHRTHERRQALFLQLRDDIGRFRFSGELGWSDRRLGSLELVKRAPEVVARPEDVAPFPIARGVVSQRLNGQLAPQPGRARAVAGVVGGHAIVQELRLAGGTRERPGT